MSWANQSIAANIGFVLMANYGSQEQSQWLNVRHDITWLILLTSNDNIIQTLLHLFSFLFSFFWHLGIEPET